MPKLYSSLLLLMAFSYSFSQSSTGAANGAARCTLGATDSVVYTCFNQHDGAIYIHAGGGTPPYHFLWQDGDTTANRTGLTASTYVIIITDSNSCTFQLQATVIEYTQINSVTVSRPGCDSANAIVFASGGNPPYHYLWSNGSTDSTLINVPAGQYTITIIDTTNCTGTNFTIIYYDTVSPAINLLSDSFGNSRGVIYAIDTFLNASPISSYLWNTGSTSDTIYNLGPGNYCVTITDAAGCSAVTCDSVTAATDINAIPVSALFGLYPNPASNSITVEINWVGDVGISIFSLDGKLIDNRITRNTKTVLAVGHLEEGIYAFQIRNLLSGEVSYSKLEIQR